MAAHLNTCTKIEQLGVVRFLWAKTWQQQRISTKKCYPFGQHFFVDILCCIHIFCPQKMYNATLFYRGACIQGRRNLVPAATSEQSFAYRLLCVTINLDSAAI
jgi:hypothetical protein